MNKKRYFMECVSKLGLSNAQLSSVSKICDILCEGIYDVDDVQVNESSDMELDKCLSAVRSISRSKEFFREMEARAHRLYEIADYMSKNEYKISKKLGISGGEPDDDNYMLMG